ncbi:MAG TPA: M1 family metallopeptidase [Longimicrobiaceae bacterium]|nr:M1 family metallopeptidase [Longimicrobiaceae bacterium]
MTLSSPIPLPRLLAAALALALGAEGAPVQAQARPAPAAEAAARPRPYPVLETPEFVRAVERGTRTRTGRPGPGYWTQHAQYRLSAELDPATRRLSGMGTVRYHNRSPDELRTIAVHLHPNLFAPDAIRNEKVPVTGGMELSRVVAQGRTLNAVPALDTLGTPAYTVDGTVAWIRLPQPLPAGGTAELGFTWSYVVPPDGAPRTGTDGEVYFVAYWYPHVAVYDDVSGWQADPYMGNAEFYMGYADYDVSLTVPEGWLVGATGTLQNPEEVLTPETRQRLDAALRDRGIVHVVTADDRGAGRATRTSRNGKLTWRFSARDVRDFAWGASPRYLWDATAAVVGDANGDGRADTAAIHTFYRPERVQWAWDRSARFSQHSVEFLSRYLWPYPYPHMTAMDGPTSCGGMEYPMMTCIGGRRDTLSLYSVTVHEIAHMWFPMQVGSDEKRYTWQDEGLTRFNQAQAMREFFDGYDLETIARDQYLALARRGGEDVGGEVELMRHGDRYPVETRAYAIASYPKMATNLAMLRALLGEETFHRAYREYGRRWINRHPQPYDLFNTFEDVAGRDLDWFWRTWWYETWTLDQAIGEVRVTGDRMEVDVVDLGLAPMPARLAITRADGRTERVEVPVEVWLNGARRHTVPVRDAASVVRVEIDPERAFADIDRENQMWTRSR